MLLETAPSYCSGKPVAAGKFLSVAGQRFLVKGVSYGTFAPQADGAQFPSPATMTNDLSSMALVGVNTVRVYTPPPMRLLDEAARHELRVMIGVPWTQHVAFLDDRRKRREIRAEVARHVRALGAHPATLALALGNEIPPSVVRWHGAGAIEGFLRELYDEAKSAAPDTILTYVNYPPTEYLEIPFFDVCAFNVYLHHQDDLHAYMARMQLIAGNKPLLIAEVGADSLRHGEEGQASLTAMQLRTAFREGACGAIAFAWTDEWWRGGSPIEDWAFGLVSADRRPKLALHAAARVFSAAPHHDREKAAWPHVSVIVCAHNASTTIDECLTALDQLTYPDWELIVVNDGSTDGTGELARQHPLARVIDVPKSGLSVARNIGLHEAVGEIVAYCDADVCVDPQWLDYLVQPFLTSDVVGSGGPNVVPPDDPWLAQCVARAPGAPTHVLLTDRIAEHVPGCNMAFRRDALLSVGGFNPLYVRAGDDVDLCWRLQAQVGRIGFAPAALVWHRHRSTIRAYWRQQVGYGEGEEWLRPRHPQKFAGSHILWRGRVCSPLPFIKSMFGKRINAGVWGSAAFPSVYQVQGHPFAYMPHSAGWQLGSLLLVCLGAILLSLGLAMGGPAAAAGIGGLGVTLWKCLAHARASDLVSLGTIGPLSPGASRVLYRLVIAWLHFIQPLARLHGRIRARAHLPPLPARSSSVRRRAWCSVPQLKLAMRLVTGRSIEQRFWSETWTGHADLLGRLVDRLRESRLAARIDIDDGWWTDRDISIGIGPWARLDIRSLVEEHGGNRCLLRAEMRLRKRWAVAAMLALLPIVVLGTWLAGGPVLAVAGLVSVLIVMGWTEGVMRVANRSAVVETAIARVAEESGMCDLNAPGRAPAPVVAKGEGHAGATLAWPRPRRKSPVAIAPALMYPDLADPGRNLAQGKR